MCKLLPQEKTGHVRLLVPSRGEDGAGEPAGEPAGAPEVWTDNPKQPPYLFRLDPSTVYVLFLIVIFSGNLEGQHRFLADIGFWQYLGFVLPRVLATLILALGSALLYERYLIWADTLQSVAFIKTSIRWADRVGRLFGIDVTVRGEDLFLGEILGEKKELLSRAGSLLRIPYTVFSIGYILLDNALVWLFIFAFDVLWRIARFGFLYYIKHLRVWHWQDITAYIEKDKIWVDYSRAQEIRALADGEWSPLSRFVGQVVMQTGLAVVMLLVSFLYRLHRDAAREIRHDKMEAHQFWKIAAFWRAAASHLILYTSYQTFRYMVEFGEPDFPPHVQWVRWIVRFSKYLSNGLIFNPNFGVRLLNDVVLTLLLPSLWIMIQFGLGYIVKEFAFVGWVLVEPIYAWLTPWLSTGLRVARHQYLRQVVRDYGVNDIMKKRYLMHILFGDQGPLATYLEGAQIELEEWW